MNALLPTDGRELVPDPTMQFALLNDPVSLICGYNLDSNPSVNITWTNPQRKVVHNSDRYILDNGPDIVRLNITNTSGDDHGTWTCNCAKFEFMPKLTVVG